MALQFKSRTKCFIELGDLLWQVPVEDYSFSQTLLVEQIQRNELPVNGNGYTNRGTATENTGLESGNWSITVPAKYVKSTGTGTGKASLTAGHHSSVEAALWGMMASSVTPEAYSTTTLSSLPQFQKSSWAIGDIATSDGGSRGSRHFYYVHPTLNYIDFYVFPKYYSSYVHYDLDFEWTLTSAGGLNIPRGEGGNSQAQGRLIADTEFNGGPVFFVLSNQADTGYRISTNNITTRTYLYYRLYLPIGTSIGSFITTNGTLTWGATAKNPYFLEGVHTPFLKDTWMMRFHNSQRESLLTGNIYFLTGTPTATAIAGTSTADNTFLFKTYKNWWGVGGSEAAERQYQWAVHASDQAREIGVYKPGHIIGASLAFTHHGAKEVPGFSSPWRVKGHSGDGNSNQQFYIYPSSVRRKNSSGEQTFTVDQATGKWTDPDGVDRKAPGLRFSVSSVGSVTNLSIKSKGVGVNVIIGGVTKNSSSDHSGFKNGDHLVFDAGYLDDTGRALDAEVRFVVTSVHVGNFQSDGYLRIVGGADIRHKEIFGNGDTTWPELNTLFIRGTDSDGTLRNFTEHPDSLTNATKITSSNTNASTYSNVNTITLSATNSSIAVGDRLESDHIPFAVYVTEINSATLTLSDNVTIPLASQKITFVGAPNKMGLSEGQWRWHRTGGYNYIIIHDFAAATPTGVNTWFDYFLSRGKNVGGSSVFKLESCCVDTATIEFDISRTTNITFTGYTKKIHNEAKNFTIASSRPSSPSANDIFYDTDNDQVEIRNSGNTAWSECITEGVNDSDNFVINKLGNMTLFSLNETGVKPSIDIFLKEFHPTNAYNYQNGAKFHSGLAGTNGMTANIASVLVDMTDEDLLAEVTSESYGQHLGLAPAEDNSWVYNYDWALSIDGTSFSGSSFLGIERWNVDGTFMTAMRGVSEFGKFCFELNHNANINKMLLVFSTATNTAYNTHTKLNAANIKLVATPKTSTPVKESFNIPLVSGSITYSNNITMISTNELGKLNSPVSHITGPRTVTGTLQAFTDDTTMAVRSRMEKEINETSFSDQIGSHYLNRGYASPEQWQVKVSSGGQYRDPKTVSVIMQMCSFEIPTVEVDDIFTTSFNFTATDTYYHLAGAAERNPEKGISTYLGNAFNIFYTG